VTYSFADVAERLMARFEGQVPLDVVVRVARESEADLSRAGSVDGEALAELVERSAGQRLAELVDSGLAEQDLGGDGVTGPATLPSPRRPPS
jgi:hypothetical protein